MKKLTILFIAIISLISCAKQEGIGGKNTITGVIIKEEYTESTNQFIKSYPAPEERVYIIYGDNAYFADDTRTNYDGSFRFEYLNKGDYKVFVYSECLACNGTVEAVFTEIKLEERKETFVIDTIFVKKYIN